MRRNVHVRFGGRLIVACRKITGSRPYLLTTIISPIALLSNWYSIDENVLSFVIIILILESLLLAVFLVLDLLMFYIFFESILPPLFILIGLYGSNNKVRASFYLFLYTLFSKVRQGGDYSPILYQCVIIKSGEVLKLSALPPAPSNDYPPPLIPGGVSYSKTEKRGGIPPTIIGGVGARE